MKFKLNGAVKAVQVQEKDGAGYIDYDDAPKWLRRLIDTKRLVPADTGITPVYYGFYLCTHDRIISGNCLREDGLCHAWDAKVSPGDWIVCDDNGSIHAMSDASFRSMFKVRD